MIDKESMMNHSEFMREYHSLWMRFKKTMSGSCSQSDYAQLFVGYLHTYHWAVQSSLQNEMTHKIVMDKK